ncbi:hypothetical protein ACOME3_010082 [Neoechinorhynchus agilis]
MEGFLCPICLCDLGRPDFLQTHFEQVHGGGGGTAPNDDMFTIKSLINRAKDKLRSTVSNPASSTANNESSSLSTSNSYIDGIIHAEQEDIVTRSRTSLFLSSRGTRSSYRQSLNIQMIRKLEKLVDLLKRRNQYSRRNLRVMEKHITAWADDRDINRCPDCSSQFNLSRRRHHCRFCGFVMCSKCSKFLDLKRACDLLNVLNNHVVDNMSLENNSLGTSSSPNNSTRSVISTALSTFIIAPIDNSNDFIRSHRFSISVLKVMC